MTVENRTIYMDNSATTPIRKEVAEEMLPFLTENFGNPSSIYDLGKVSKHAVEKARKKVLSHGRNELRFLKKSYSEN